MVKVPSVSLSLSLPSLSSRSLSFLFFASLSLCPSHLSLVSFSVSSDGKNRKLLRVLQRRMVEGGPPSEGAPEGEGAPQLQKDTQEAAAEFIRGALMASGGKYRKGTTLEKMERAKPRRARL